MQLAWDGQLVNSLAPLSWTKLSRLGGKRAVFAAHFVTRHVRLHELTTIYMHSAQVFDVS